MDSLWMERVLEDAAAVQRRNDAADAMAFAMNSLRTNLHRMATAMTEQEWITCDNPALMLKWLTCDGSGPGEGPNRIQISERKLRLFCAAMWRRHVDILPQKIKKTRQEMDDLISIAERYADGLISEEEVQKHRAVLDITGQNLPYPRYIEQASHWLITKLLPLDRAAVEPAAQAALLREIVGNPWRPAYHGETEERPCPDCPPGRFDIDCDDCGGSGTVQVWKPRACLAPDILAQAQACYDDRLPDGTLDHDRLAVLADAMEEAGCNEELLLSHLRGMELLPDNDMPNKFRWTKLRSSHVRGCWALDLLLGNE